MVLLENVLIGIAYILSSVFLLGTYGFADFTIWSDPELRKLSCYRLILAISVADLAQVLILGTVSGIISIANADGNSPVCMVFGAILVSSWYASTSLALILSFNRFIIIWKQSYAVNLFNGRKVYIWIGIGYAYMLATLILYLWPGVQVYYHTDTNLWLYNMSLPLTESVERFNVINDFIAISLMTVFHIGIFAQLKAIRSKALAAKSLSANEKRAIAPAFIISLTMTFLCFFGLGVQGVTQNKWVHMCIELAWIYAAGLNGILILGFNKTIRLRARKFLGKNSQHQPSDNVVVI